MTTAGPVILLRPCRTSRPTAVERSSPQLVPAPGSAVREAIAWRGPTFPTGEPAGSSRDSPSTSSCRSTCRSCCREAVCPSHLPRAAGPPLRQRPSPRSPTTDLHAGDEIEELPSFPLGSLGSHLGRDPRCALTPGHPAASFRPYRPAGRSATFRATTSSCVTLRLCTSRTVVEVVFTRLFSAAPSGVVEESHGRRARGRPQRKRTARELRLSQPCTIRSRSPAGIHLPLPRPEGRNGGRPNHGSTA